MGTVCWKSARIGMAVAAMLAALPAPAQEIRRVLNEEDDTFVERFGERTSRVSGDIVMGVMLTDDDASHGTVDVAVPTLEPLAGAAEPQYACVRIVSKDGRYEAENTYEILPSHPGPGGVFPYEGQYATEISGIPTVALVTPARCGDRAAAVIPAGWAGTAREATELKVFLNAAGNPTSVAVGRGDDYFEPCRDVSEIDGLKYTSVCAIPMTALPAGKTARLNLFVTRSFTEETFQIDVVVPD